MMQTSASVSLKKTAGIVKSNKEQQTDKVTILKKEEALKAVGRRKNKSCGME